ncbi:MAG: phage minor capsid protein [Clostridium sp.]|nr:phage minor capsid protein [Clostridium sp.]
MQPNELAKLPEKIEALFIDMQNRIMLDVVRRIRKTGGITSTADYQLQKMQILGNSSEFLEAETKRLLNATYPEVFELYDEVIEKDYVRDKSLYEQVNAKYIPYKDNETMQAWVEAARVQTNGQFDNITKSMGFSLNYGNKLVFTPFSEYYQKYLDRACMDIVTGAFDYNSVLRRVVKEMTSSGIRTVDYASGHSNRIDVAARRAVMTGVNQLSAKIHERTAEDLGTDMYEVTWHTGARPSHWWGGRVYTKQELADICHLGEVTGLCGANCRHSYHAFIPGISVRTYTDEQLDQMNAEEVRVKEWKGKEYNVYQATQKQRQMETAMRAQREKVQLLRSGRADPDVVTVEKAKYQGQLNEYARFCKIMDLKQQRERIYIDLRGRVAPSKKTYVKYTSGNFKNTTKKSLQGQLSYVYNGVKDFIPTGTDFSNVKTIAGAGSDTPLRAAHRLAEKYGGASGEWSKFAGKIESGKYIFDVHWYERNGKQYDAKLKVRKGRQ